MGKLFDIQGGAIIPKEDCYIIKPLKRILDENAEDGPKILAFLHYMSSVNPDDNPYADVPEEEKADQIMNELDIFVDVEDESIKEGLECVQAKYATTFSRMYRGIKAVLDKAAIKLFTTDIDFNGKQGNSDSIKSWIKDYESLRKSFKTAYRDYEEERNDVKVRGGGVLADDEETDY